MFYNKFFSRLLIALLLIVSIFIFFDTNSVLATNPEAAFGTDFIDDEIVLSDRDPRTIVAGVLNFLLGFLAIIAVVLVIYAGFLWMTSGGSEDKISKAKSILKSALIGLLIILASWGIVRLVFGELSNITGIGGGIGSNQPNFQQGVGAVGACTVESVYPSPGQKNVPRNSMIMITFKEEVYVDSLNSDNVKICLESDFDFNTAVCANPTSFTVNTNDNKIFVLSPESYLGSSERESSYVVYLSNDVLKLDQSESIFNTCSPQNLLWQFLVSNKLDLSPPQIDNVFPGSDNLQDTVDSVSSLEWADASIIVNNINDIKVYQEASISSSIVSGGVVATPSVSPLYDAPLSNFTVTIDDSATKAQLVAAGDNLGVFDINNNSVNFTNYFNLSFDASPESGNSWNIVINPMIKADTLTMGSAQYTFVSGASNGFSIQKRENVNDQAAEICSALVDNSLLMCSSVVGASLSLQARVGGSAGNSLVLDSSNTSSFTINSFSGGSDAIENVSVNGLRRDKPMNSIIQINFNEAINPMSVSGRWDAPGIAIRVFNDSDGGSPVEGEFIIASNYKTVEFISDSQCGVNGCGDEIFCLPSNSNIRVEIDTPDLYPCTTAEGQCLSFSPFSNCTSLNGLSYSTCQNVENVNYPLASPLLNGITDSAGNALDANRDGVAKGPINFFDQLEYEIDASTQVDRGDSFSWSFWINDIIDANPPVILQVFPVSDTAHPEAAPDLFSPVRIDFDKLLSASSIRTGKTTISKPTRPSVDHYRLNLLSNQLVGYWTSFVNRDVNPTDGEVDRTTVLIEHAPYFEGATYRAHAGSGILDIYQNCYKPSSSASGALVDCQANPTNPSCCDGVAQGDLCF